MSVYIYFFMTFKRSDLPPPQQIKNLFGHTYKKINLNLRLVTVYVHLANPIFLISLGLEQTTGNTKLKYFNLQM